MRVLLGRYRHDGMVGIYDDDLPQLMIEAT